MDEVFSPYGTDLPIREKAGQWQGALECLHGLGIMVGGAIKIAAAAATAYEHRAARGRAGLGHVP